MTVEQYAKRIVKLMKQKYPTPNITIGISNLCKGIDRLHQGYRQADKALEIARTINSQDSIVLFSKLGPVSLLLDARNPEELKEYADSLLLDVLESDTNDSTELLKTMYYYFNNECNMHKTSRNMNLSVGGLRYRLAILKDNFHLDLSDATI